MTLCGTAHCLCSYDLKVTSESPSHIPESPPCLSLLPGLLTGSRIALLTGLPLSSLTLTHRLFSTGTTCGPVVTPSMAKSLGPSPPALGEKPDDDGFSSLLSLAIKAQAFEVTLQVLPCPAPPYWVPRSTRQKSFLSQSGMTQLRNPQGSILTTFWIFLSVAGSLKSCLSS